jgi:sucrose-6-phosphate hydrolase SacC (GH32 family)
VGFSRRAFLRASSFLACAETVQPRLVWTQGTWKSMLCWKLDDGGDTAREQNSSVDDPIASRTGQAIWVGSGKDRALRLDGYSVWVAQQDAPIAISGGPISIMAWLALESYPVNQAAVVHLESRPDGEMSFAVDRWGYVVATTRLGGASSTCKSSQPIPKAQWHHLAVVVDHTGMTLFMNGRACGHQAAANQLSRIARRVDITLGKSPQCEVIASVFPTGVLNGLLRHVCIFDGAPSESDLGGLIEESRPGSPPNLQINGAWCSDDPHRPAYHALPPRAWTNEPHGLIHWGGQYHLFYQKNPNGPYWGHIHWGHMTSPDLYQWTEMPVALSPEPGPDSEGCWSGSVIEFQRKLAILYTAGDGHRSSICLAVSEDGIYFTKHNANPVIPEPPPGHGFSEFRDPFVWREGETYYVIIGSAIKDKGGTALLYRSKDLATWEYRKPLLVGDRETSGVFWEMPIFVKVGDQHALIVCEVPGRASYWVGNWKDETFVPMSAGPHRLELLNHLLSPTPHMLEDGSVIAMGIIPDERSPKQCWRAGWAHHYSLPRLLSADAQGRLHQTPFERIKQWSELLSSLSNVDLPDGAMKPIVKGSGNCLNIHAVFKRGESRAVTLRVRSSPDEQEYTDIHYHWEIGRLILDRSHSSLDPMVKRDVQDATYFPDVKDVLGLDVYLDESVLEVFVDQRNAFAARIYPTLAASTGVLVGSEGSKASLESITVARIKSQAIREQT